MQSLSYISSRALLSWLTFLIHIALAQADQQTVVVTAAPTSPHPPSYTSPTEFKNTVLSVSNDYRTEHAARHFIWNETLTEYAENWAKTCNWEHSHGPYGENLAFGYPNASTAISAWGNERKMYNFQLPTGFSEETGHFTQLVWRESVQVGCAAVDCGYDNDGSDTKDGNGRYIRAQGWYVVCEYSPAGNVMGDENRWFRVNVRPSRDGHIPGVDDDDEDDGLCGGAGGAGTGRGYIRWLGVWLLVVHGVFALL